MDEILEKVEVFARDAHGEQRRKFVDEPFLNHPVRVMKLCGEYTDDLNILCAALLHDVLEDTEISKANLMQFLESISGRECACQIIKLVEELTDIYSKKNYPKLNRRQRKTKEAKRLSLASSASQTIKYADIIDNSTDILNAEPDFARLFLYECSNLLKVMSSGNAYLRQKAIETVGTCIEKQKQSKPG